MQAYATGPPMPRDHAGELDWILFRQHHVLSRRQALRFMTGKALRSRISSGRWQAVARSVYVTHNGPVTREQLLWIAVLAVGRGRSSVLGGPSALECHGLRGYCSERIHVLVPAGAQDRDAPDGVTVHRTTHLPRGDVDAGCPPRTVPARSLVDAAQWAGSDLQARAIVTAGFQQRLVNFGEVAVTLDRMPRAHRRSLTREKAADAAGGAHSLPEAEFLRLCRRDRLPLPSRQTRRQDRGGRWRYLDAYFEEWGVHVEIDGGHHLEVRQWWADMRRQNDLWIPGDRLLRFPSWVIRRRPYEVATQLRAALMAAGWRPDAPRRRRHAPAG